MLSLHSESEGQVPQLKFEAEAKTLKAESKGSQGRGQYFGLEAFNVSGYS